MNSTKHLVKALFATLLRIPDVYYGIYYLGVFFEPPKHVVLTGNLIAVGLAVTLVYGFKRQLSLKAR